MINCFGWIIGIALRALTLGDGDSMVFLPLLLMLPIALMAVIVHEGGHYLAARNAGMTVLQWALRRWNRRHGLIKARGMHHCSLAETDAGKFPGEARRSNTPATAARSQSTRAITDHAGRELYEVGQGTPLGSRLRGGRGLIGRLLDFA